MKIRPLIKYKICLLSFFLIFLFLTNYHYFDLKENSFHLKSTGPLTPKGIRLTSTNNSSNSIVISWYTESQPSDPKLIYSNEASLASNITVVPSYKLISGTYIHSAFISKLDANKTYYYKVSSDASNEREILNFTTPPARNATMLKFLIFGDSRSQREQRSELVKKIVENFDDIDFTIHTGDIVNDGTIQNQWNDYFDDVENLTNNIIGYFIEGNHEHIDGYMYDNIPLPSNGENSFYYSFNIGPVNFIGLNTGRDSTIQTTWLETVLNKSYQDNNTLWRIGYMHKPIFNSLSTRPDLTDLISNWCPLFEEYKVDMVFAGHNHYYERSYPMNRLKEYEDSTSFDFKNPSNPMYFITGGAGAPLYTRDTNPGYAPFYNSTYHFIIVEISVDDFKEETKLNLEIWAMPNDYNNIYLIDNLTIVKKGAIINIHSPVENQVFGHHAPKYNVTIEKKASKPSWCSINTTWYTIDNGFTNYTFKELTGTINQTSWSDQVNESIRIIFFANDSLGNTYENAIIVHKDIIPPNITILLPEANETFGKDPPSFIVIIEDKNLDTMWYNLNGGLNITFTINGTIDYIEWDKLLKGTIIITFYANDSAGNISFKEIAIEKMILEPVDNDLHQFQIGLIIFVILFSSFLILSAVSLSFLKRFKKKKSTA
ncbi:MAG: purple acid phosphatase family protein [Candidatus Hodarchaeota archaeon]